MKGQPCCGKSGALLDRSVVSSHLFDSAFDSAFIPHARSFSFRPSLVSDTSCGVHGVGGLNACGFMHGVVMHDNSLGVREKSRCVVGHGNSCNSHADELRGETKGFEYEYSVQG